MPIKNLAINLDTFGFVQREKGCSGGYVSNRCGRDFLYYALHYFYPEKYNSSTNNPLYIQEHNIFGLSVHPWFTWTLLQFIYAPKLLVEHNLELSINNKNIRSFFDFCVAVIKPSKATAIQRIKEVEVAVDNNLISGINISFGLKNLFFDHVMMVYGYDEDNLYIFDTHQVPKLEYEKLTQDNRYIMRLPKTVIQKRWSLFGRVWTIKPAKKKL